MIKKNTKKCSCIFGVGLKERLSDNKRQKDYNYRHTISAVSIKLMPWLSAYSICWSACCWVFCSPQVMLPRQIRETGIWLLPSFEYSIEFRIPVVGFSGTRIIVLKKGRVMNENEYELLAQNDKTRYRLRQFNESFLSALSKRAWCLKSNKS